MPNDSIYRCRVCGFREWEPPWGIDGKTSTVDYCSCCGVQFGYQDCLPEGAKRYRTEWLEKGAKWAHPELKPEPWSVAEQLKKVPAEFA